MSTPHLHQITNDTTSFLSWVLFNNLSQSVQHGGAHGIIAQIFLFLFFHCILYTVHILILNRIARATLVLCIKLHLVYYIGCKFHEDTFHEWSARIFQNGNWKIRWWTTSKMDCFRLESSQMGKTKRRIQNKVSLFVSVTYWLPGGELT